MRFYFGLLKLKVKNIPEPPEMTAPDAAERFPVRPERRVWFIGPDDLGLVIDDE